MCGESTSGCVRASSVDAYSLGYHVSLVEERTYDRSALIHKVNLFDLAHKYVGVMKVDEVVAHRTSPRKARRWRRIRRGAAEGPPELIPALIRSGP